MFLSKRTNGYYYFFYDESTGKRQAVSTKTKLKSEALKFLTQFRKESNHKPKQEILQINLNRFKDEFLLHSQAVHTFKTTLTYKNTFNFFEEYIGDTNLSKIREKDIRSFIDNRIINSSAYPARKT